MARRLQLLLDLHRYSLVEAEVSRSGRSVAAVIREAIDVRFDNAHGQRAAAARELLDSTQMTAGPSRIGGRQGGADSRPRLIVRGHSMKSFFVDKSVLLYAVGDELPNARTLAACSQPSPRASSGCTPASRGSRNSFIIGCGAAVGRKLLCRHD